MLIVSAYRRTYIDYLAMLKSISVLSMEITIGDSYRHAERVATNITPMSLCRREALTRCNMNDRLEQLRQLPSCLLLLNEENDDSDIIPNSLVICATILKSSNMPGIVAILNIYNFRSDVLN